MSYTTSELRYALKSAHRDKEHRHDVAWAGTPYGSYSVDGDTFASMLDELDDEDPIAFGLTVVFEDGCWLTQESDDFGESPTWEMVYPPQRGEKPFTRLSGDEDIEDLQVAS